MSKPQVFILAAGRGSRMKSDIPKVMHKVNNKTMLDHVLENASAITDDITIIYSDHLKPYLQSYSKHIKFVLQDAPLGTGHAVYSAIRNINSECYVIILCGDNPFITSDIITKMLDKSDSEDVDLMLMASHRDNPTGYGRVVLDEQNMVSKVIECKVATSQEKAITLCNSGVILGKSDVIKSLINDLIDKGLNSNGEYYLTSIIEDGYKKGYSTSYFIADSDSVMGVNTMEDLEHANRIIKKKIS